MKIIAFSPVKYTCPRRIESQKVAIDVLSSLPDDFKIIAFDFEEHKLPQVCLPSRIEYRPVLKRNSSKEIGNSRALPFIKEIFNSISNEKADIIGYINSDILLGEEFISKISEKRKAYLFSRFEIAETNSINFKNKKIKHIFGGNTHCGTDGIFFEREWWKNNSIRYDDDLVLGETHWDTCYYFLTKHLLQPMTL